MDDIHPSITIMFILFYVDTIFKFHFQRYFEGIKTSFVFFIYSLKFVNGHLTSKSKSVIEIRQGSINCGFWMACEVSILVVFTPVAILWMEMTEGACDICPSLQAMKKMSSTDTPLHTVARMQEKQREMQTPYIVLSGGGKNLTT